jgi:hypothetical protein
MDERSLPGSDGLALRNLASARRSTPRRRRAAIARHADPPHLACDLGIMIEASSFAFQGFAMQTAAFTVLAPLFAEAEAEALVRRCETLGSYGMYRRAPIEEELGGGLFQRRAAAMNYIQSSGRFACKESLETALLFIDEYVRFPQPAPEA